MIVHKTLIFPCRSEANASERQENINENYGVGKDDSIK